MTVDWTKLTFEERMKLRAERRASPEYQRELQMRREAIERRRRHREIRRAIRLFETEKVNKK
jgi:hypothetical protein